MITMGDSYGMNGSAGMLYSGNSGTVNCSSTFTQTGTSCDSLVVDSVPELKHRGSLAVEWSVEEQYKLEEALPQYVYYSNFLTMFAWLLFSLSYPLVFVRKLVHLL